MARQPAVAVENNFRNGLITESTGLNFPENACTETFNCVFDFDGSVKRRNGFDFEADFMTKDINRLNSVVREHVWKNVGGNGDVSLLVMQVGATIYFYKLTDFNVSSGAISSTIDLTDFSVSDAPTPEAYECQFSDGNGCLFVTHPFCETFYVTYDTNTDTPTATQIDIKIRDFEGDTADTLDITDRPTATLSNLDIHHKYNLYNQGWNTTNLTAWDTARTDMPSNSDVMWSFKSSSDAFDASTVANVIRGNTPAPTGHFILSLFDQDRDTASGLSGTTDGLSTFQRCTTSAFFAGRVFYSGLNYSGENFKIFFTQIIQKNDQYGFCYQINDPTSEDFFDLLPSDGGVIRISDAGTIYKLVPVVSGLLVFAANGIWLISGSTGLGFAANDYTVNKISSVSSISATSFIDIGGFPAWWNYEGIYTVSYNESGNPVVQSLTHNKIKTFYEEIPFSSKIRVKGYYDPINGIVQWLYRSANTADITERYEFDRILNYNVRTGALYPWILPSDIDVKVNGIFISDTTEGFVETTFVEDSEGNLVVTEDGDNVVIYSQSGTEIPPVFRYICSYPLAGAYKFTIALESDDDFYVDWKSFDNEGVEFESYFITGYKIRGEALRKYTNNWLNIYSKTNRTVSYDIQGIWDYANTGSGTGRWSSKQRITHSDTNFDYSNRRIKIRGSGLSLQFKVSSTSSLPFKIIGWAQMDMINQVP